MLVCQRVARPLSTVALNLLVAATVLAQASSDSAPKTGAMLPSESNRFRAVVTAAEGQVSMASDNGDWAISQGEDVPIQRTISTGRDGHARLEVQGGSNFEIYANSRVIFRQNPGYSGDLLDVVSGHVRVHLGLAVGAAPERIHCRSAIITTHEATTVAIATDEDGAVRIDVIEGEISIRHALRPSSNATVIRAVDAIVIRPDEEISRRVERGTLYRYTVKPMHDLIELLTPGRPPKVEEQQVQEHWVPEGSLLAASRSGSR